ncbi:hypothetical protein [Nocardioides sp. Leaf307]|uniref:hypothetical protein n=1 Tax=Nocardioides sp. Leaf307 TaxID=1736331 RepID=UPI00071422A7|nr:hypothetical protein [Nocardioides sp. Leaf307]KQQ43878.1 hypothetical protein ASF50_08410 [Nocardioides sp. Leaf307]
MSTPSPRRHGAAFVLPLAALVWSAQVGLDERATGADLSAVAAVSGASGAAWQLLHRRDLVDRLTHFAAAFTVVAVLLFAVVAWGSPVSSSLGTGVGLGGVLTGLVHTEQWLRGRDRRRARRTTPQGPRQPHGTAVD